MIDPRANANGNLAENRIDLKLIADLVEPQTRVLDIGCGNGQLMELLVNERGADEIPGVVIAVFQNEALITCPAFLAGEDAAG